MPQDDSLFSDEPSDSGGDQVLSQAQIDALLASMLAGGDDDDDENNDTAPPSPPPVQEEQKTENSPGISEDELTNLFSDNGTSPGTAEENPQSNPIINGTDSQGNSSDLSIDPDELEELLNDDTGK